MAKTPIMETSSYTIASAGQPSKQHLYTAREKPNTWTLTSFSTFCTIFFCIFLFLNTCILPALLTYLLISTLCEYRVRDPLAKICSDMLLAPFESIYQSRPMSPMNRTTKYCAGVTPWTQWQIYGNLGITMRVDTRNCSFSSTPIYYTSIGGIDLHNGMIGSHALYAVSSTGFDIYPQKSVPWTSAQMLNYSQIYQWNFNWVGLYLE